MEEGLNWNDLDKTKNLNKTMGLNLFCRGVDAQLKEHHEMREIYFGRDFREKFFSKEQFWTNLTSPSTLWHQPRMFNKYEKSKVINFMYSG